jgi:hypothetical protein
MKTPTRFHASLCGSFLFKYFFVGVNNYFYLLYDHMIVIADGSIDTTSLKRQFISFSLDDEEGEEEDNPGAAKVRSFFSSEYMIKFAFVVKAIVYQYVEEIGRGLTLF